MKKPTHKLVIWILVFMFICIDAQAASRRACRNALVVTEVTQLNFGDFVGAIAGKVTVATDGSRTSTGPILVSGGIVSPGVFSLYSTIDGCSAYPVRVRTRNGNLTGSGANMRVNGFVSDPVSETFFLKPTANDPITVTVGADLSSGANQGTGPYMGTYRVRFNLRR